MAEMFASVVGDDYTTLIHHFSKKMRSCSKCGWCKGNVKEAALLRVEGMLFTIRLAYGAGVALRDIRLACSHHKARLWCETCKHCRRFVRVVGKVIWCVVLGFENGM